MHLDVLTTPTGCVSRERSGSTFGFSTTVHTPQGAGGAVETRYDEHGNIAEAGLFADGAYDDDDREADAVWAAVDDRLDERRRDRREARLKQELEEYRVKNPKITEQFADLKRKLSEVSAQEWDAIPDVGNTTVKHQKRMQNFAPVPDTLLARAAAEKQLASTLDERVDAQGRGAATPLTDLTALGESRGTVLALKLERLSDSVSGQTVVDPRGYLTDLGSLRVSSDAEVSDIKKARLLLKSVVQTNPAHAPGWIAAARLEELAGKLSAARQLAQQGCDSCPGNEDMWLECARLQPPDAAKAVLARGVAALPLSVKLWLAAADVETDMQRKQRVLRRALEALPTSVRIWKALVDLSGEDDARVLLSRAVECCPQHIELWLALAHLESYEAARTVLNKAREALPREGSIWISASKLEEAHGNGAMCLRIIDRGIKSLRANGCVIDRDAWLRDAEAAEQSEPPAPATAAAIVAAVLSEGVDEQDRKRTWLADAADASARGAWATSVAIYDAVLAAFPTSKKAWIAAAHCEKRRHGGGLDAMLALLRRATANVPGAPVLWLLGAKEAWLAGDVATARAILGQGFQANPESEDILLAAFKVEFESGERARARALMHKARASVRSGRVWMKAAMVEREEGDIAAERTLLTEGVALFPADHKLWLMLAQLEHRQGNIGAAREAYAQGVKHCSQSEALWVGAARLEEDEGCVPRARALLETARLKLPRCPALWLAAVRTESRSGDAKAAEGMLAKALQECPTAGILWAEAIALAPRPQRKTKSVDALRRCDADPHVMCCVAGLFAADRKTDKARAWFERCVTAAPDVGDFWARYVAFEAHLGAEAAAAAVAKRCCAAQPRHGEFWARVAKRPENAHESIEKLLAKVVTSIEQETPP